jgi:hypothetical protein
VVRVHDVELASDAPLVVADLLREIVLAVRHERAEPGPAGRFEQRARRTPAADGGGPRAGRLRTGAVLPQSEATLEKKDDGQDGAGDYGDGT